MICAQCRFWTGLRHAEDVFRAGQATPTIRTCVLLDLATPRRFGCVGYEPRAQDETLVGLA